MVPQRVLTTRLRFVSAEAFGHHPAVASVFSRLPAPPRPTISRDFAGGKPHQEYPMSKFSDFVAQKKLDLRRIRIASVSLEKLRPEDRAVRLAHKNRGEGKPSGNKGAERRSGRPITPRALDAANAGKSLTGPQKTRLLNAVNRVLEQKKQEAVTLEALF